MGTLRKLRVKMDDILDAMVHHDRSEVEWLFDVQTGEVRFRVRGEMEEEEEHETEGEPIPTFETRTHYRLMSAFAASLEEPDVRAFLEQALAGKGAFGRFRDAVARFPDIEARWRSTLREALVGEATEWLNDLGIEPEIELLPVPPPEPPKVEAGRPSLLHVLLLGAPDGKTEVIDGRVLRRIRAKSASDARGLFRKLAQDLAEMKGVAWRKRFAEGSTFELEDIRLELHGDLVEVTVEVPPHAVRALLG